MSKENFMLQNVRLYNIIFRDKSKLKVYASCPEAVANFVKRKELGLVKKIEVVEPSNGFDKFIHSGGIE